MTDTAQALGATIAIVLFMLLTIVSASLRFRFRADITTAKGQELIRRRGVVNIEVKRTRSNTYYRSTSLSSSEVRRVGLFDPEPRWAGPNVLSDTLHLYGRRATKEVYLWSYRFSEEKRTELLALAEAFNGNACDPQGPGSGPWLRGRERAATLSPRSTKNGMNQHAD